jgi:hypothetical protein
MRKKRRVDMGCGFMFDFVLRMLDVTARASTNNMSGGELDARGGYLPLIFAVRLVEYVVLAIDGENSIFHNTLPMWALAFIDG